MFNPKPIVSPLVRHVGFLVPPTDREASFPAGDGPRVLVSLSTTFQAQREPLSQILAALGQLDVQAIVTTSAAVSHDDLEPPPNVHLASYVPHAAVLGNCDVVVTHGGLGTLAGALSHGVPVVCQPVSRDQPLNAARVRELGVGLVLDPGANAEDIAANVREVLREPSYREKAQEIAEASREAGETKAAAAEILSLAAR